MVQELANSLQPRLQHVFFPLKIFEAFQIAVTVIWKSEWHIRPTVAKYLLLYHPQLY